VTVQSLTSGDSNLRLFGHLERTADLNPEIADRALEFGVSQKQLNRPQILSSAID
jgi:hypothetical protein